LRETLGEELTLKIKGGFLVTIFGGVIAGVICVMTIFGSMRNDVISLLKVVEVQQKVLEQMQKYNNDSQVHFQSIDDKISNLATQIEIDRQWRSVTK